MSKKKKQIGICVGGPAAGEMFIIDGPRQIMLTPADPFYIGAVYEGTNRVTILREIIYLFNHCLERNGTRNRSNNQETKKIIIKP